MQTAASPAHTVALLVPTLVAGGAERVTLNLAEGLRDLGCQVDLVVFAASGELAGAAPLGTRVVDLGSGRALWAPLPLARYLRRERPDVLVSAMGHTNLVAILAAAMSGAGTRLVVTEHSTTPIRPAGFKDRAYRFLSRLSYRRANAVVAVSTGVADSLAAGVGLPRGSISVIYNPVFTSRYLELIEAAPTHPWFGAGGPPVVLGVGRLVPEKDFPTLIRAFAEVRAAHDARLVIFGDGPERDRLERLVGELGLERSVAMPGFVGDAVAHMAAAGVFVLSSRTEGLPTVLIEALGTGTPVVSTDCESGPREILRGGELGRLVPVGDPDALAQAIVSALSEPRRGAPPGLLAEYAPQAVARRYLESVGLHA